MKDYSEFINVMSSSLLFLFKLGQLLVDIPGDLFGFAEVQAPCVFIEEIIVGKCQLPVNGALKLRSIKVRSPDEAGSLKVGMREVGLGEVAPPRGRRI